MKNKYVYEIAPNFCSNRQPLHSEEVYSVVKKLEFPEGCDLSGYLWSGYYETAEKAFEALRSMNSDGWKIYPFVVDGYDAEWGICETIRRFFAQSEAKQEADQFPLNQATFIPEAPLPAAVPPARKLSEIEEAQSFARFVSSLGMLDSRRIVSLLAQQFKYNAEANATNLKVCQSWENAAAQMDCVEWTLSRNEMIEAMQAEDAAGVQILNY